MGSDTQRCTAMSKTTGQQCRQPAIKGSTKCHYHGGKTPKGIASPHFKTGRYSRHLPAQLAERYEAALTDPDLISLRDEIALTDAEIGRALAILQDIPPEFDDPKERSAWHREQGRTRTRINDLIEQRRKLVETERKRLVDLQQMMTAEQAMLFMSAIVNIVRRHVDDRDILAAISADVDRLITQRGREPLQPGVR